MQSITYPNYRVFPDYCASGVWDKTGACMAYEELFEMGASKNSIDQLEKMQYVFEHQDTMIDPAKEEEAYIQFLQERIALQLTEETGQLFRSVS